MDPQNTDRSSPIPQHFGELLRRLRQAAGLTQEALAERARVSARAISDLERGVKQRPRRETIALLSDAIGLGPDDRALLTRSTLRSEPARLRDSVVRRERSGPVPWTGPRHNLPAPVAPLVGREADLAAVTQQLRTSRALTLTGPGGCGKTSLATEVAREALADFSGGVWLVELALLSDGGEVGLAVAAALDLPKRPGEPVADTLIADLQRRRSLLIVDSCEHLVDEVASLTSRLLRGCPQLHVLATSRQPLGVGGEVVWRVASLAVPPPDCPFERVGDFDAVRLFVGRATAIEREFALTADNAPAITEICRRLDGLPLAIELAAARIDVLQPSQILARLANRFQLLTGGWSPEQRHQTLRGLLDWSYNLLPEDERALFRRLAGFPSGFSLDACVASGGNGAPEGDDSLSLLSQLARKSLVQVERTGSEARYRLSETVRAYAWERLVEAGEAPTPSVG
jgi:predicted ATPase/transcriptional regulator with XRE-family HTH domain